MDTVDTGESSGHVGETRHLLELRTVLLGAEESGKSSAGNTILGKPEFTPGVKTVLTCKKVQANVAGRQVTVVDTPGWVGYFPAEYSPELLKDQIAFSVSLCPPGPHAVLLVINLGSSFQEEHRRAVQEHLELLSDTVWGHTILLLTCGDTLREMTIEQQIEREGQALQWVLEKCGNRYHVLSSKNSSEVSQVSELLEMIEKMVADNGGYHFHIERKVLQDMKEKRRITEERANRRVRHVLEHREILRDLLKVTEEREAGWSSAGVDLNAQEDTEGEAQTTPWITEQSLAFLHNEIKLIFEKEWGRKEGMINERVRTEVKSYITPPAKGTSMDHPLSNLKGVPSSEPDASDIATSCIKVCDWLKENHSGNSAAASGHESSEMDKKAQNTETSDITGRDEELEHCGTVTI